MDASEAGRHEMVIGRRQLLGAGTASAALLLAKPGQARAVAAHKGNVLLSAHNPIATSDQRDVEDMALRILQRPEYRRARQTVELLWLNGIGSQQDAEIARFPDMLEEYMFNFALRAANSDADYPKVARLMAPPHRWFGRDVPGSRWGGDSPDFIYRMIPISPGGHYEIHGRITCNDPPLVTYQALGMRAAPIPMGILDSLDMVIEGKDFVITVDERPAEGRKNHLQILPGADHIIVRDALGDWIAQTPNILRIVRTNAPKRTPLTEDEMTARAVQYALDSLYYVFYIAQSGFTKEANTIRSPRSSTAFGGQPTQVGVKGHLDLGDDDALIVHANMGGALFRNVVLCDAFYLTVNYWSRIGSLNMRQMREDATDGFTYVVSHRDPGVHNWLDTSGIRRLALGQRWQAIPRSYQGERPDMTARLVKFGELERHLADGVVRIDPAQRREQVARRQQGFSKRFVDT